MTDVTRATQITRPSPLSVLELLKPITWFPPMWAFDCGVRSLAVGETLLACSWVGVTASLANNSPKLPFHLRNRVSDLLAG
jgi:hypothetical protein